MNITKNLPFSFYIVFAFVICQIGFATQMAFSISNLEELLQNNARIEHNWSVTTHLENISNLMQDTELGLYRFAFTKNREFMQEIKKKENWRIAEFRQLDLLLTKTDLPGVTLEELRSISDQEMRRFLNFIALDENQDLERPLLAIDVKQNEENRDKLRDLVAIMEAEQSALIMAKWDGLNEAYRSTIVMYILISVTCSIALLLFYGIYTKKIIFLKSLDSMLRRNSAELHGEVATKQPGTLSRRLLAMSEQEKANVARELHDELGSNLMIIRINIATALDTFGQNNAALASHLRDTLQLLKKTVDIKRRIVENLRPSMLENFGLAASLRSYCEEIACRSGIKIDIEINGNLDQLDSERSLALYRIVQESLTNTVKYAKATRVSIALNQFEYGVRLHISDNGIGITQDMLKNPKSHGILGMRERAALNGGSFNILSNKAGGGTRIDAFIPCVDL